MSKKAIKILFLCAVPIHIQAVMESDAYNRERSEKMSTKNEQKPTVQPANRPQTPQPPYPYHEQEVIYQNKVAGITLAGTLTLPRSQGPFPVVLLISGMGPMDRDSTFMGHKRFAVIADHLTRHGIAVLRADKRGIGKSTGTFSSDVTSRDLADDVLAGMAYLKTRKEIDSLHIGLIGHSEGGLIATIIAAESKDVAFVALISGAVITSIDGQTETTATQLRFDGASEAMIARDCAIRKQVLGIVIQEANSAIAAQKMDTLITHYWETLPEVQKQEAEKLAFAFTLAKKDGLIANFNAPWFRFFFSYDVPATLRKIKIPLLALNGELDFNTPDIAFPIIRTALHEAGNTDYTTLTMPKLNHNMQTSATGSIPEYATIEETIAPVVLQAMAEWLLKKTGMGK